MDRDAPPTEVAARRKAEKALKHGFLLALGRFRCGRGEEKSREGIETNIPRVRRRNREVAARRKAEKALKPVGVGCNRCRDTRRGEEKSREGIETH